MNIELQQAKLDRLMARIVGFWGAICLGLLADWSQFMERWNLLIITIILFSVWCFVIIKFVKERDKIIRGRKNH